MKNKIFKNSISTTRIGQKFEYQALLYLENNGFSLITKNYISAWGEIDLIVKNTNLIAFIEVRARNSKNYGGAIYSITPSKQSKIITTANFFMQKHQNYKSYDYRFDVILFQNNKIEWIQNCINEF